jgi:predicted nucleic acid-binding Zn ribbon protein
MLDLQREPLELGGLWRDVLNFLGDREITPDLYLPLADAVLPKWGRWTYFLGHAAAKLTEDRAELGADVARARIGWRVWIEQRENLRKFAAKVAKHPVEDEQLERWWIDDARGETASWDGSYSARDDKVTGQFRKFVELSEDDDLALRYHPDMRESYMDGWHIGWLHSNLTWTGDLELLRTLARKTWPADPRDREQWTPSELESVNAWYEDQQPSLATPDEKPTSIDPFELKIWNDEQNLGFGLDGLRYVMLVFLRSTWIDFVDSILERSKRPNARGSLSCIECGTFVGRRALGYGQLYCSDRCKKRAAKRRYRQRRSLAAIGPALHVVRRSTT